MRVSSKFRLKPSEIIRRAVDKQLEEWERAGQIVVIARGGDD